MKLFTRHLRSILCLLLLNNVTFIKFRSKKILNQTNLVSSIFCDYLFFKHFEDQIAIVLFDPRLVTDTIYAARLMPLITPGPTCF